MNKSLQEMRRISAGIMSPAARCTTSPGTNCARGISLVWPSRTTVAFTLIMALSLAAAVSARASWTNRNTTPRTTMTAITVAARISPVTADMTAKIDSRITKGFIKARPNSRQRLCRLSWATTFGPCSFNRRAASAAVRPWLEVLKFLVDLLRLTDTYFHDFRRNLNLGGMPGGPNFFGNCHESAFLRLAKTREWGDILLRFRIRYPERSIMISEHTIDYSPRKLGRVFVYRHLCGRLDWAQQNGGLASQE